MQTPAQVKLVDTVAKHVLESVKGKARLLNMGAGRSTVLESLIAKYGCDFTSDRLDVDDCSADHPNVGECFVCSAEHMKPLKSDVYDLIYSNYVLEHIENLDAAAQEIHRILKPGGLCVCSIPNPKAPEFAIARHTPLWFHRLIRGGSGWHTHYAYTSVKALGERFSRAGMEPVEISFYPCVEQYFERFILLRWLGALYDCLVRIFHIKGMMGNICLVTKKSAT